MILWKGKDKISNKSIFCQTRRCEQNIPQLIAISLLQELSGLSFSEITERYKIVSYNNVVSSNFLLKGRIENSTKLKKNTKS